MVFIIRLNNSNEALRAKQVLKNQGFSMAGISKDFNELRFVREMSMQRAKRLLKSGGFRIFN